MEDRRSAYERMSKQARVGEGERGRGGGRGEGGRGGGEGRAPLDVAYPRTHEHTKASRDREMYSSMDIYSRSQKESYNEERREGEGRRGSKNDRFDTISSVFSLTTSVQQDEMTSCIAISRQQQKRKMYKSRS